MLVIAVKNLQTEDRLLQRNDKAVCRVLAGLPALQRRSPPQSTGNIDICTKVMFWLDLLVGYLLAELIKRTFDGFSRKF